jgi:hypothetical protein
MKTLEYFGHTFPKDYVANLTAKIHQWLKLDAGYKLFDLPNQDTFDADDTIPSEIASTKIGQFHLVKIVTDAVLPTLNTMKASMKEKPVEPPALKTDNALLYHGAAYALLLSVVAAAFKLSQKEGGNLLLTGTSLVMLTVIIFVINSRAFRSEPQALTKPVVNSTNGQYKKILELMTDAAPTKSYDNGGLEHVIQYFNNINKALAQYESVCTQLSSKQEEFDKLSAVEKQAVPAESIYGKLHAELDIVELETLASEIKSLEATKSTIESTLEKAYSSISTHLFPTSEKLTQSM